MSFVTKKKEGAEALEKERQVAKQEELRQERMKEEADAVARQEAYEKAATEEVVVDTAPRPIPPEVKGSLATVAEGDEEEDAEKKGNLCLSVIYAYTLCTSELGIIKLFRQRSLQQGVTLCRVHKCHLRA